MSIVSGFDMDGKENKTGLPAQFSQRFYYGCIGGIIVVIFLVIPLLKNNYFNHLITEMLLLACLGQAWNIMYGNTGQFSFGHAAFFGIGVYTSGLLYVHLGITPWVGMFVGGCFALVVGAGIGKVSFRYGLRGVYFAFVTLASAEIFLLLTLLWEPLTGGGQGILLPWTGHNPLMFSFAVNKKYLYYYIALAMAICYTLIAYWIKQVRLGYFLAAIREDEDAAEILGIDGPKYKLVAISISAFLTALCGTFYLQYYQHVEPELAFGVVRTFEMIFPVILGGGGYVLGPPLGAFVLQSLEETVRAIMPPRMLGFHRMIYGALLVIMIMYLPGGLMGLIESGKDRLVLKYKNRTKG